MGGGVLTEGPWPAGSSVAATSRSAESGAAAKPPPVGMAIEAQAEWELQVAEGPEEPHRQWPATGPCTASSSWQTTPVPDVAAVDAATLPAKNASKSETTATNPMRDRAVPSTPGNRLRRTLASSGRARNFTKNQCLPAAGRALICVKKWRP